MGSNWTERRVVITGLGAVTPLGNQVDEFWQNLLAGRCGIGRITRWERVGQDHVLDIAAPPEVMRYVVFKGSMAVDGISLTVAGVQKRAFRIWIIPHTYEVTALRERQVGDAVNLEADLLGKYVEKFIAARGR